VSWESLANALEIQLNARNRLVEDLQRSEVFTQAKVMDLVRTNQHLQAEVQRLQEALVHATQER
jgi:acetyl-CoA carboxylase beta subunit